MDKGHGSMLEGCITGIEENWFQGRIADSAYALEKSFNAGRRIVVGVNAFTEGNEEDDLAILRITNADETKQVTRLAHVRATRESAAVDAALATLAREAADPTVNLMPALIDAAKAQATVGEMMGAMVTVFGRHVEVPSL